MAYTPAMMGITAISEKDIIMRFRTPRGSNRSLSM
jgi:hypothetical protein